MKKIFEVDVVSFWYGSSSRIPWQLQRAFPAHVDVILSKLEKIGREENSIGGQL